MANSVESFMAAYRMQMFLNTPVFETHVAPFLATEVPKRVAELTGFLRESPLKAKMEAVHAQMERWFGLKDVTAVSKAFRKKTEEPRAKLLSSVVKEITLIHEKGIGGVGGAACLKEMVDCGCYLRALRIYFYMKPQALENFASDPHLRNGWHQNILHAAVNPESMARVISEPFVSFVLAMDRNHALGLSRQIDIHLKTPLEMCRLQTELRPLEAPVRYRMVGLLMEHENAVAPPSAKTMEAVLRTPVFEKCVAPFLTTAQPKQLDRMTGFNTGYVKDDMVVSLNVAHKNTEQLYALLGLSRISKTFKARLQETRAQLAQRVVTCFSTIHEGQEGVKTIRDLVDAGWYLRAMRIYFFAKPEALHNFAITAPNRDGGWKKNILHRAVCPNLENISLPFVSFVLDMDRTHKLELYKLKNSDKHTPLEGLRYTQTYSSEKQKPNQERAIQMLTDHETAMAALQPAQLQPVQQPAQAPQPEQKAEVKQLPPEVKLNLVIPAHLMAPERDAAVRPAPLTPKSPVHRAAPDAPSLLSRICSCVYAALASLVSSIAQTINGLFAR